MSSDNTLPAGRQLVIGNVIAHENYDKTRNQGQKPTYTRIQAPWLITQEGLELVIAVVTRGEYCNDVQQRALNLRGDAPMANSQAMATKGNVAVIPVMGPLVAHASILSSVSAATSYDGIRANLTAAIDDPGIQAILLNIDSPGGEANGCSSLVDAIYAARDIKPVTAYVGGTGASAAYWIASACTNIVANKTAELGSIGVRMAVLDDRKANEAMGVKTISFVSTQSPHKVLDFDTDDGKARMQTRIDAIADEFIESVARNRGVDYQTVIDHFGGGDMMIGKKAVKAGLADSVGDLETLISTLGAPQMKSVIAALSLPATATEADALVAVMGLVQERNALLKATGKATLSEAVAIVDGLKIAASEVEAMKVAVAKQAKDQEAKDFDIEIDAATKAGILPPAEDNKRRKHAMAFKGQPNGLEGLRAFLSVLDPVVSPSAPASQEPKIADMGVVALSVEEKELAKKMGIKEAELLATKTRRVAMVKEGKTASAPMVEIE